MTFKLLKNPFPVNDEMKIQNQINLLRVFSSRSNTNTISLSQNVTIHTPIPHCGHESTGVINGRTTYPSLVRELGGRRMAERASGVSTSGVGASESSEGAAREAEAEGEKEGEDVDGTAA